MNKKKIVTVLIVIATVILAGVAVFTAIRLYQLREEAVAPTAPTSEPAAAESEETGGGEGTDLPPGRRSSCTISFTVAAQEAPSCYETCTTSPDNCPTGLECQTVDAQTVCVDPDCPEETDCVCEEAAYSCDSACTTDAQCQEANEDYVCYTISDTCRHQDYLEQEDCQPAATESPTATPTESPTATATSSAEPGLPEAGVSYPTIISGVVGILLILISLALAL